MKKFYFVSVLEMMKTAIAKLPEQIEGLFSKNTTSFKNLPLLGMFIAMVLACGGVKAQVTSYLGLDGGFEGSAPINNTATGTLLPVAGQWSKANTSLTIANETGTIRSGANSLKVSSSSATTCRVFSPLFTISASTTKWVVQYYRRATSTTATIQNQLGNHRGGVEALNGMSTPVTAINAWELVSYAPTSVTSATSAAALILAKMATSAGDAYYDDFAMYESSTGLDVAVPNPATSASAGTPSASSLLVGWTVASGGVDGGGYLVVRGTVDPTTAPNVNGIYAVTNTIAAGMTVVYNGTGTSFTDNGLTGGTTYYYRIYTYDKAYNYAAAVACNGATSSSCTQPTAQASFTSASNVSTTQMDIAFGAGTAGNGRLVVIAAASSIAGSPASGTAYTTGLTNNFSTTSPTIATGEKVVYKGAVSPVTVTGLSPETQYAIKIFEYNSTGDCYLTTGTGNTGTQYTLSTEPSAQAASLSGTSPVYSQVDLTFPSITTAGITNADGYIILQKTGSAPTGLPADGSAYIVGATIGDATVAAIVNSTSATTQSVTGLSGNTNYYFTLIPFNWNSSTAATYNYRTAATIPGTNVTTLVQPSNLSDIVFNSASTASTNVDIAYATYQSATISNTGSGVGGSIGVMGFTVRDGGLSASDADNLPTILTGISFNVTNVANIRSAALFNGNTLIASVAVGGTSPITFTGLSGVNVTCADNSTLALNLRVTFNSAVTDNQKMVFTVASATAGTGSTSSLFAAANAGGAVSENTAGTINQIEVTADRLRFTTQPADQNINTNLAAFVVKAQDANSNTDLDAGNSFTLTTTGTGMTSTSPYNLSSGVKSITDVQFNATQGPITLTATTTGLAFDNDDVSSGFTISNVAIGTYRTLTGTGTWSGISWQRFVSGTGWTTDVAPTTGTADSILIYGTVDFNTTGSWNLSKLVIKNGGSFTQNNSNGLTITTLLVNNGGTVTQNSLLTVSSGGVLELEDGATYIANYKSQPWESTLWNGTEKFHPSSNFILYTMNGTTDKLISGSTVISNYTNGSYSAPFGNVIIDFGNTNSVGGYSGTFQLFYDGFAGNVTHGNLIFRSSNGSGVRWALSSALGTISNPVTIGGNVVIESTYDQVVSIRNDIGNAYVYVKGDIIYNAANTFRMITTTTSSAYSVVLSVDGNININSGNFYFNSSSSTGVVTTLNLKGDLSVGSGALFTNLSTSNNAPLNFSATGDGLTAATTQTVSIASTGATRNQNISAIVKTGSYVQLSGTDWNMGVNSTVTVQTGSVLDFGFNGTTALNITNYASGTAFTSAQGSTLKISSPAGISGTSGSVGNVQTTNAPAYNPTAIFHYIGKANQVTGTGLTNTIGNGKIIIAELNTNSLTLTPTNNIDISSATTIDASGGRLDIRKGTVIGTSTSDFSGSGRLVMTDGDYQIATITAAPLTSYLPQLSTYNKYSLTGGTITLNGTTGTQILSGTPVYYNVAFSGSNTLGTNYKGISSATDVKNSISISTDAVVDVKSSSLGPNASPNFFTPTFTMANNARYITDGSGTKPDAGGAYSLGANTTIEFANSSGAGIVRLAPAYANVVVSGTNVANNSTGTGIKFQSGGTFTVKNGATFKLSNTLGFTNTTSSVATAISYVSPSSPTITLETNSTIEYNGAGQTVTANSVIYQNLTLSGSGTTTAPTGTLTVQGNLVKSGTSTFTANGGTVLLNGAAQSFAGLTYNNLWLDNAGIKTLSANAVIVDSLRIGNISTNPITTLELGANYINLQSTSSKTARVGTVAPAAVISYGGSGRFVVERNYTARRGWRLVTAPITADAGRNIYNSWQSGGAATTGSGTFITGPFAPAGGLDVSPFMNYSLKVYNDPNLTGVDITTTKLLSGTAGVAGVPDNYGMFIFVRGDRSTTNLFYPPLVNETTLRDTGKVQIKTQTFTLTGAINGYSLVGNPFASQVNMNDVMAASVNVNKFQYYMYDPYLNSEQGGYLTYTPDGGGVYTSTPPSPGGQTYNIHSSQALYVQRINTTATLTFTENNKTGSTSVGLFRPASVTQSLRANLYLLNAGNAAVLSDGVKVQFDQGNSNAVDIMDAVKFPNIKESLCLRRNGKSLAVESRSPVTGDDTLFLNLTRTTQRNYQFQFEPDNLDPLLSAFLEDSYTNTKTPVSVATSSSYDFTVNADSASAAISRFRIVFKLAGGGPLPVTFSNIKAYQQSNNIAVEWTVENELNISKYEVEKSMDGVNFSKVNTTVATGANRNTTTYNWLDVNAVPGDNFYRVRSIELNGKAAYSRIVKVRTGKTEPSISVYPNPVTEGNIGLQLTNMPAGVYQVRLINSIGQLMSKNTISHPGGSSAETIFPGKKLISGSYQLEVIQPRRTTVVIKVLVK